MNILIEYYKQVRKAQLGEDAFPQTYKKFQNRYDNIENAEKDISIFLSFPFASHDTLDFATGRFSSNQWLHSFRDRKMRNIAKALLNVFSEVKLREMIVRIAENEGLYDSLDAAEPEFGYEEKKY
jgi:hypothetical protein